jgi:hypothetical protein
VQERERAESKPGFESIFSCAVRFIIGQSFFIRLQHSGNFEQSSEMNFAFPYPPSEAGRGVEGQQVITANI